MRHTLVLVLLIAPGCTSVSRTVSRTVDADGVTALSVTIERGDFTYVGTDTRAFAIDVTSTGRGSTVTRACANRETNRWGMGLAGGVLSLDATSGSRASVDFDIVGPDLLDVGADVERGAVHLEAVEGVHAVAASRITSRQLLGDADLLARSGGMDVEIWPYLDGQVFLESRSGDVTLLLPFGGDYDLEVVGDPGYELYVTDLGFHTSFLDVGYFAGVVGDGSISVRVVVTGGSFELLESL